MVAFCYGSTAPKVGIMSQRGLRLELWSSDHVIVSTAHELKLCLPSIHFHSLSFDLKVCHCSSGCSHQDWGVSIFHIGWWLSKQLWSNTSWYKHHFVVCLLVDFSQTYGNSWKKFRWSLFWRSAAQLLLDQTKMSIRWVFVRGRRHVPIMLCMMYTRKWALFTTWACAFLATAAYLHWIITGRAQRGTALKCCHIIPRDSRLWRLLDYRYCLISSSPPSLYPHLGGLKHVQ